MTVRRRYSSFLRLQRGTLMVFNTDPDGDIERLGSARGVLDGNQDCGGSPKPFSTVRKNNGDPQSPSRRQSGTVGIPRGVLDRHRELWGSDKALPEGNQGLWGFPEAFSIVIESSGDPTKPFPTVRKNNGDPHRHSRRSSRLAGIPEGVFDSNQEHCRFPRTSWDGLARLFSSPKPFPTIIGDVWHPPSLELRSERTIGAFQHPRSVAKRFKDAPFAARRRASVLVGRPAIHAPVQRLLDLGEISSSLRVRASAASSHSLSAAGRRRGVRGFESLWPPASRSLTAHDSLRQLDRVKTIHYPYHANNMRRHTKPHRGRRVRGRLTLRTADLYLFGPPVSGGRA